MTIVIRRSAAAVVTLAAAALLLSACGSGPSQVDSALIVGNTSVSVDQVQQELNNVLATQTAAQQAQQQGKLADATRALVTGHVLHALVTQAATRYGLTVTDQQVDQLITQAGGASKIASALFVDSANVRDSVRDVLLEASLARKYADTLAVNFGYVVTATRAEAVTDAQKLAANPASLAGLVSAANAAGQANGGQTGGEATAQFSISSYLQGLAQAQQQAQQQGSPAPTENLSPVLGTPADTVIAFQPDPQNDPRWYVVYIKSRTMGAGAATNGSSSADTSDVGTLQTIGVNMLQSEASTLGVRISPRYGVWNQVDMTVAASDDQTAGVELPVKTAAKP